MGADRPRLRRIANPEFITCGVLQGNISDKTNALSAWSQGGQRSPKRLGMEGILNGRQRFFSSLQLGVTMMHDSHDVGTESFIKASFARRFCVVALDVSPRLEE